MKLEDEVSYLNYQVRCMQETIENQRLAIHTLKRILINNGLIKDHREFMEVRYLCEAEEKKNEEEFNKFLENSINKLENSININKAEE